MLLAREKKIVTLLMEHEDKLTTTQIATSLKVSSRTIKTDLKKINEELEKHSCRINSQQGVGLWIEYDNHEAQKYLKEVARDTVDSYLSPEVRKYHLAVELLLQDNYTSMEALAKEYYISKATVLNDLNELDELWEHYGVHFIKKVKYGIKVEGNESQIRSALLEALKRAGGRQKVTVSNIQSHFTSVELKDLREIIGQMEGRFQFILTDISVGELMLDLAVMLERLSAGKTMDHEGSIPGRESRRMDFVLGYLKEHLTESFGIEIPDTEDCYLRICLSGLRFHVPMEKEQSLKEKRERNPEMFDYMMDLLMECDRKFYLQLEEDDELINALMDHLECMVLRLHSKMYTYNPILDAIKKELFYEYEIASFFMSKFTVKYGFNPTEDEIGFITFHIGTSIERMKQKQHQKFTATLVCMTGFGTSQFLRAKLAGSFSNLEIREVFSASRLSEIKLEKQDFVIATVPIELEGIPVIQVSPVLSETDIKKIQKFLMKKKEYEPETQKNYEYLQQFLHSEIAMFDCDLKSKEEVIHLLGSRMITEGYVDEGFIDSVFERENLSETALGNLIAIPHAFEGHNNYAVMAINCVNMEQVKAVIESAEEEKSAVIINISPRQMKAHGYGYIMAPLIENLAKRASVPVAFNLDHGANFEDITAAMQYGFSSVMIDSSSYEFEENVRRTQQIASLAHGMGLSCEAELGHVGQAAQADDSNVDLYTNVKQAKEFVERTNCDCLAVAIGTAHGAYPKGMIPKLDFERLKELKAELDMPLVLHGGSGAGEENIRKAVACGINKINVCTDLMRHATNASIATLKENPQIGNLRFECEESERKGCSEETWRLQAILHGKREEGTGGQAA